MKKINLNKKTNKEKSKDLKQKLNMFDRLPDHCLTCDEPFDKKNREQAQSWFVVVKNSEQSVKIYCPECWDEATKLIKDLNGGKDVSESPDL